MLTGTTPVGMRGAGVRQVPRILIRSRGSRRIRVRSGGAQALLCENPSTDRHAALPPATVFAGQSPASTAFPKAWPGSRGPRAPARGMRIAAGERSDREAREPRGSFGRYARGGLRTWSTPRAMTRQQNGAAENLGNPRRPVGLARHQQPGSACSRPCEALLKFAIRSRRQRVLRC